MTSSIIPVIDNRRAAHARQNRSEFKYTDLIGADNYMWSNDYSPRESSWPGSRDDIERNFQGVPEDIKRIITWNTAKRLYRID